MTQPIEGDTLLCEAPVPAGDERPFEPTWQKFCASLHDATGRVVPNQNDPMWRQYFNIYAIGYVAALRAVSECADREAVSKTKK